MLHKIPTKCVIVPVWRRCCSTYLIFLSCQYGFDFKKETTIIVPYPKKIFIEFLAYKNKTARWQHLVLRCRREDG